MLLGQDQIQQDEKGILASFKRKWRQLDPKKQKTITLTIVVLMITVVAAFGYHSRKAKATRKPQKQASGVKEISLNTDLIEKSLFRQAQETINQQGKLIADIRKEIAKIKAQSDQALEEARKAREAPAVPTKTPVKQEAMEKSAKVGKRPAISHPPPQPLPPPPPPPVMSSGGDKGQSLNILGGITVVKNMEASKEPPKKEDSKKNTRSIYPLLLWRQRCFRALTPLPRQAGRKIPCPCS